jgi:hypothetical protein
MNPGMNSAGSLSSASSTSRKAHEICDNYPFLAHLVLCACKLLAILCTVSAFVAIVEAFVAIVVALVAALRKRCGRNGKKCRGSYRKDVSAHKHTSMIIALKLPGDCICSSDVAKMKLSASD